MRNLELSSGRRQYYFQTFMTFVFMLLTTHNAWAIPPSIVYHPDNKSICSGANATFSITASNATSYQWQEDNGGGFVNISNGGELNHIIDMQRDPAPGIYIMKLDVEGRQDLIRFHITD